MEMWMDFAFNSPTKEIEVNPKSWTVDYDANLVNLY